MTANAWDALFANANMTLQEHTHALACMWLLSTSSEQSPLPFIFKGFVYKEVWLDGFCRAGGRCHLRPAYSWALVPWKVWLLPLQPSDISWWVTACSWWEEQMFHGGWWLARFEYNRCCMVGYSLLDLKRTDISLKRTDVSWWVMACSNWKEQMFHGGWLLPLQPSDISWWVTPCLCWEEQMCHGGLRPARIEKNRCVMVGDALLVLGRTDISWWVMTCSIWKEQMFHGGWWLAQFE